MAWRRNRHSLPTDPRTWLILLVLLSPLFYDCYRRQSQTGIYVAECSGVVVSARPTIKSWLDFFDRDNKYRNEGSRYEGHYVAIIRDERTHRRKKVAISE